MTSRADLPRLDDLPIPADVAVGSTWPESMREMADWIGALDTLRVSEAFGGQEIYISHDAERSPLLGILTPAKVATISRIYGGNRHVVPTGASELRAARRAGVIAAVRAKDLSVIDAAKICGTSRTYMSYLVNRTEEGHGAAIPAALPKRAKHDPRQIDMFDADPA